MKYSDFLEIYVKQNGGSVADARRTCEKFLSALTEAFIVMETGESLAFVGTGKFTKVIQKGKKGLIPGTNKPYLSKDKNVIRFKPGKKIVEKINP